MTRLAIRIALGLACSAGSLLAAPVSAAEWLLTPSGNVATAYADNPRLREKDATSSTGAVAEMSATLQRRSERLEWTVRPRIVSARYSDAESLDSNDQYLTSQLSYFTERSQWNGSLGLTRDSALTSELGTTGLVQADQRHESITASAGPTFMLTERVNFGVQASVFDHHYPGSRRTGLVDYQYRAFSMSTGYSATERSNLSLALQGGELVVPDQGSRTRDATLRLGWTYEPFSLWRTKLSAGPSYVDAGFGTDSGMVFDVDVERRGERWMLISNVGRNLNPTGRGVLAQRDQVSLALSRQLGEFVSGSLSAQWARNQDLLQRQGIVFDKVEYGVLSLGLSWRFAEHWSLAWSVSGTTQSVQSRTGDAENYRTSLSMVWNGQTQSL